jgi:hypothetical protein
LVILGWPNPDVLNGQEVKTVGIGLRGQENGGWNKKTGEEWGGFPNKLYLCSAYEDDKHEHHEKNWHHLCPNVADNEHVGAALDGAGGVGSRPAVFERYGHQGTVQD